LEFLKASWIGARPPISSVHQSNWLREPMDCRRAHRAKRVLVTIPEKFSRHIGLPPTGAPSGSSEINVHACATWRGAKFPEPIGGGGRRLRRAHAAGLVLLQVVTTSRRPQRELVRDLRAARLPSSRLCSRSPLRSLQCGAPACKSNHAHQLLRIRLRDHA
jgi:hypothetical protein